MIQESGTIEKAFNAVEMQPDYSSWSCLTNEFRFFTPSLLYWHTHVDRDLVSDFINQKDIPVEYRPKRVRTTKPLYSMAEPVVELKRGLKTVQEDLSRMLYVCPKVAITQGEPTVWEMLEEFITGIDFVDVKTGFFACAMPQPDLKIFDVQAFTNGKFLPEMCIPVATWGLYTNRTSTLWRTRNENSQYTVPVASVLDATKMTKEEAFIGLGVSRVSVLLKVFYGG